MVYDNGGVQSIRGSPVDEGIGEVWIDEVPDACSDPRTGL